MVLLLLLEASLAHMFDDLDYRFECFSDFAGKQYNEENLFEA